MQAGDAVALAAYLQANAGRYGVDPRAAFAVSTQEGLGGGIGDNGTSFGPWQLHQGGAYPASAPQQPDAANAWAWSKPGIDYALRQMGKVSGGQTGDQAVVSIVSRFERPRNVPGEIAGALKVYHSQGSLTVLAQQWAAVHKIIASVPGSDPIQGAIDTTRSLADLIGKLLDPAVLIRGLEIVGGGGGAGARWLTGGSSAPPTMPGSIRAWTFAGLARSRLSARRP